MKEVFDYTKEENWYLSEPPSQKDLDLAPHFVELYKKTGKLWTQFSSEEIETLLKPIFIENGYEWIVKLTEE